MITTQQHGPNSRRRYPFTLARLGYGEGDSCQDTRSLSQASTLEFKLLNVAAFPHKLKIYVILQIAGLALLTGHIGLAH